MVINALTCLLQDPSPRFAQSMKGERFSYLHRLRTNSSASIGGGSGGSPESVGGESLCPETISPDVPSPTGNKCIFKDKFDEHFLI